MASRACVERIAGALVAAGYRLPAAGDLVTIVDMWVEDFAGVPDAELIALVQAWRTGTSEPWYPTSGQILAMRRASRDRVSGRVRDSGIAWERMLRCLRAAGRAHPPATGDAADGEPPPRADGRRHGGKWYAIEELKRPGFWNPVSAFCDADGVWRTVPASGPPPGAQVQWMDVKPSDPLCWRLHDDPEERHAMEAALSGIGGWNTLADAEHDAAFVRRFRDIYDAHTERQVERQVYGSLDARMEVAMRRQLEQGREPEARPVADISRMIAEHLKR